MESMLCRNTFSTEAVFYGTSKKSIDVNDIPGWVIPPFTVNLHINQTCGADIINKCCSL